MRNEATERDTVHKHSKIRILLFSFLVIVLVNLKLAHFDRAALGYIWSRYIYRCFGDARMTPLFEVYVLYRLILYLEDRVKKWPLIYTLPAAFFAFWMIEGRYFEIAGSVDFCFPEKFFVLLCALSALGYFFVYYFALVACEQIFLGVARRACVDTRNLSSHRLFRLVEERPFVTSLVLLLVASIPLYCISYPALFMGDTRRQVMQALGYVPLYYMHPVLHTLMIRLCLKIGMGLFGSENIGLFLNICLQGILIILALSFCVHTLVKNVGVRGYAALLVPLVFVVHPRCYQYLVQVTKDTTFCAFLLCYLCCTIRQMLGQARRYEFAAWVLFAILTILFRRDGMYVIIPTTFLIALFKGVRIKAAALVAIILVFLPVWDRVVMPALEVQPGSSRVVYSLIFQSTARYLTEYPDDVTPEEHDAIDAVLHYDQLVEKYQPELSDLVIRTYREEATKEDMKRFFQAMKSMFRRHPDVFFRAVFQNKFEYFYPSYVYSEYYNIDYCGYCYRQTNESTGTTHFHMPIPTYKAYLNYQMIREGFWHLPGLGVLISSFAAVFTSAFLLCFGLRRHLWRELTIMMICLMQIAIVFAGPTNGGYFRYSFPIVTVLPVMFLLICRAVVPDEKQEPALEASGGAIEADQTAAEGAGSAKGSSPRRAHIKRADNVGSNS